MSETGRNRKNFGGSSKVTIDDVAKLAGVSPGTVSHALNNVGYVNERTREKVKNAVEALGYVPNRAARNLKTSKTGLIMMAIPDNSNEIYFDMINSFQEAIKKRGYSMLLYYTGGQYVEEMKVIQLLKERVVDGLFMVHFSYKDTLLNEIIKTKAPVVLCGMCNHIWTDAKYPFDTISIDVYKGIYSAVKHLIHMGHKKIGYLAGRYGINVYQQRFEAYRDALRDNGIEYREEYVCWNDYTRLSGYNAARNLMQLEDPPTCICASNDHQAIGCWEALREFDVRIPEDMALTGMDDLEISKVLKISSLKMREHVAGEEAARLMMNRLDSMDATCHQNIFIIPELVVRESSLGKD